VKVAYLVSKYPAVSHTFVLREVLALRAQEVEVITFSVRKAGKDDVLGPEAQAETATTRCLVRAPFVEYWRAVCWAALNRPGRSARMFLRLATRGRLGFKQRLRWFCYLAEAILLARWLAAERIDHLHCHFGNSGSSTGMLAAELAGVPFSLTCHGGELLEPERHCLAEKVANAVFVACVSKYGRSQLMLVCSPEHWSKLHIVRCGLQHAVSDHHSAIRHANSILCVGRLSHEKGHLILLDALAILRGLECEFHCLLVGDGPMRSPIESRICSLGLGGHVTLAGARPLDEVMGLYATAGVTVLASLSEGIPVALMEAMASGCPVVATRISGVPELIQDGVTGWLVSPGDAKELAEALYRVLKDPGSARALTNQAARFVQEEFSQDQSAKRLICLLRDSTARKGSL
jgi:colanic acid/amylovoran biosynthesis glycosyltransferase